MSEPTGGAPPSRRGRKSPERAAYLAGKITLAEYEQIRAQMIKVRRAQHYRDVRDGKRIPGTSYSPVARRKNAMLKLIASGKTLQEVGDKFGVTRERVRQIVGNVSQFREAAKVVEANRGEILRLYAEAEPVAELSSRFHVPALVITGTLGIREHCGVPIEHGTVYGYDHYHCRCEECSRAYAERQQELKRKRQEEYRQKKKAGDTDRAEGGV